MFNATKDGWVDEPNGRGTWGILSTCILTIVLCCWTSMCPNIPAPRDGFLTQMRDKLHLTILALVSPEILLIIPLGEWSSARASVKAFHELGHNEWSIVHAFYADMGGFILEGPGIDTPFPVDGQQLLFLVRKGYVQYPDLTRKEISDRNKSDGLARCIVVFQALWMVVNSLVRVAQCLALATIELTTLSFVLVFLLSSFCWYYKPQGITTRTTLRLETHLDKVFIENDISPQSVWYCTPLDFVHTDNRRFHVCERWWRYYMSIFQRIHFPVFSRPVKTVPYNRIPSDHFLALDLTAELIGYPIIYVFGSIFMFAWNFPFPSSTEKLLWRMASIYTLTIFTTVGTIYGLYCEKRFFPNWLASRGRRDEGLLKSHDFADRLRNAHPSKNPMYEVPLRAVAMATLLCVVYGICRAYILIEDVIGLRSLPESAYETVNWSIYVPHL